MDIYALSHKSFFNPKPSSISPIGLNGFMSDGFHYSDNNISDNISHLNKFFCELTGIYYIWKSMSFSEYIGFVHYRRFFCFSNILINNNILPDVTIIPNKETLSNILIYDDQEKKVKDILSFYDIIVPKASYSPISIEKSYVSAHDDDAWLAFKVRAQKELTNIDINFFYQNDRRNFYWNMFVTRSDIFKLYCENLFSILFDVFQEVGLKPSIDGIRYQPYRYPGYLAERFMAAFITNYNLRYYESRVLMSE